MSEKAITPDQRRAAAMLGAGREAQAVAAELGVTPKTIARWKSLPEVHELIVQHREALLPDGAPSAESVLVQALAATRPNGSPSWGDRIAAAKALLAAPAASADAQDRARRVERVYLRPPGDDDDRVIGSAHAQVTDPFRPQAEGNGAAGTEAGEIDAPFDADGASETTLAPAASDGGPDEPS
jgi:hypothetical protein